CDFPPLCSASVIGVPPAKLRTTGVLSPEKRDDIKEILASIPNEIIENEDVDHDFTTAQRLVDAMQERGELDQMALLEFAKARQYAATIAALARYTRRPLIPSKRC